MNVIQARKFISICYYILLNRAPDKKELDYWVKKAINEKMTETDIIYEFVSSKEFINEEMSEKGGKL